MRSGLLAFLLFCVGCLPSRAQKNSKDSAAMSDEYFKMGMEVYDFTHRKQSTELFVLAIKMNPKNARANFMAGKSIMLTIRKEESLAYYRKAFKLDPKVDEEILYYIGQGYQYSEKFDSAIQFYERFNKYLARTLNFNKSMKISEVNRKIFECRNAKIFKANPVDVTISDLSTKINSEWPDYAPNVNADETLMVFTSRRPEGNMNPSVADDHEYYEDIYYARRVNGEWQEAKNIGPPLNSQFHNASVNLTPDGKEMFIYNDDHGGDIFSSRLGKDGAWSAPKSLEGINTEFIENSATITSDGQRLYFTSDRPGSYGGTDIYTAVKNKNGRWVDVQNLGPTVNTELDEEDVFISINGDHLYFSSNGHAGMGDMDIYRSAYDSSNHRWQDPLNLGYPINSVENDIYFVLSGDEKHAYYSSVKAANKGEQDIYRIDMENWKPADLSQSEFIDASLAKEEKEEAAKKAEKDSGPSSVSLEIVVLDDISSEPLDAKVALLTQRKQTIPSLAGRKGNFRFEWTNESGLNARYELTIARDGYMPHVSPMYFYLLDRGTGKQVIRDTIRLSKLGSQDLGHFITTGSDIKTMPQIIPVHFENDSSIPGSYDGIKTIVKLMKDNPGIKVEIAGHTDDVGPSEYNLTLSCRRAESVRNYIIFSGIDAGRVMAAGYGEYRPLADNKTTEGRQLNRRTEFTIIGQ
jgi:outer membrane protein OmpA-like peptidoglycan-associated protein/tetratricopeptide (TPR) repeat protein